METRRHNGYGVDLTGGPANLDMAILALNTHQTIMDLYGQTDPATPGGGLSASDFLEEVGRALHVARTPARSFLAAVKGFLARAETLAADLPPPRKPAIVKDGKLICPECGGSEWWYVESIQNHRNVGELDGDTLMIEGHYETGEGYDDGTDAHLECRVDIAPKAAEGGKPAEAGGTCLCECDIPPGIETDFV